LERIWQSETAIRVDDAFVEGKLCGTSPPVIPAASDAFLIRYSLVARPNDARQASELVVESNLQHLDVVFESERASQVSRTNLPPEPPISSKLFRSRTPPSSEVNLVAARAEWR
jgi:hypothetical protein